MFFRHFKLTQHVYAISAELGCVFDFSCNGIKHICKPKEACKKSEESFKPAQDYIKSNEETWLENEVQKWIRLFLNFVFNLSLHLWYQAHQAHHSKMLQVK